MTREQVHTAGKTVDERPGLAVIAPTQEWYRHALHRRLVREIPELRLHSIYTHAQGVTHRQRRDESDINAVFFDNGQSAADRNSISNQFANLSRSKRIFEYLKEHRVKAAIILGYNDIGLLRLFRRCRRAGIHSYLWSDSNAAGDRATGIKRLLKAAIIRSVSRQADAVFVCGSLGRDFYTAYGVPESKIIYSPYEPDYDLIKALPQQTIEETRQAFKIDQGRKRFVFCGRLVPAKRPDLVVRSFVKIAHDRPDWDLLIIGSGELRSQLEADIPEDLKHRITLTGFLGEQSQISALYRLSHVLVHPCEIEPWGLIINEAVAAGLAVITTTACGAGVELVESGVNGVLIPPASTEPLTQAMLKLSEPGVAERFGTQSANVLDRWRQSADPVLGIRRALNRAGLVAPAPENNTNT